MLHSNDNIMQPHYDATFPYDVYSLATHGRRGGALAAHGAYLTATVQSWPLLSSPVQSWPPCLRMRSQPRVFTPPRGPAHCQKRDTAALRHRHCRYACHGATVLVTAHPHGTGAAAALVSPPRWRGHMPPAGPGPGPAASAATMRRAASPGRRRTLRVSCQKPLGPSSSSQSLAGVSQSES